MGKVAGNNAEAQIVQNTVENPSDGTGNSAGQPLLFGGVEQDGKGYDADHGFGNVFDIQEQIVDDQNTKPPPRKAISLMPIPTPTAMENAIKRASIRWISPDR